MTYVAICLFKKYMRNTWEIHEKYIEISLAKYMRNTWEIHVFKNTWEIHEKYMRNT